MASELATGCVLFDTCHLHKSVCTLKCMNKVAFNRHSVCNAWVCSHFELHLVQRSCPALPPAAGVCNMTLSLPLWVCCHGCHHAVSGILTEMGAHQAYTPTPYDACRSGRSLTMVTQYDVELFQKIEALTGHKMEEYPSEQEAVLLLLERVGEAQRISTMQVCHSLMQSVAACAYAAKIMPVPAACTWCSAHGRFDNVTSLFHEHKL